MTRVDFYTRVADKEALACRLCAKAFAARLFVLVVTRDPDAAERLDRLMWSVPPTAFVPHCRADHPRAHDTPVLIHHGPIETPRDDVLVNLADEIPPFFGRFERLVEIVGCAEDDIARGRDRYRFYRDRGYALTVHDMSRVAATVA